MKTTSVSAVLEAAQFDKRAYWLRSWGEQADDRDLEIVLTHLWSEQNPEVLENLLRVFSSRAMPRFDPRLIDLCGHQNKRVQRWAFAALEKNCHPLVRHFAWKEIVKQSSTQKRFLMRLFIANFEEGDEQRILDQIPLPDDACDRHSMLSDLVQVLEENEQPDASKLSQIAYFEQPCDMCRYYAVRLLHQRKLAPQWMIDECRFDSNDDSRALVDLVQGDPVAN